jgi:predicted metalloprotease with PDZ domain
MFSTLALTTLMFAYPAPRDPEPPDKGPGYLGVTFQLANDGEGVEIMEVRADGPAMGCGLRSNDKIRKFGGEPIRYDSFAKTIIRARPGTVVPLEIERGSQRLIVKVRLGVRPEDFPVPLPEPDETLPQLDVQDAIPPRK